MSTIVAPHDRLDNVWKKSRREDIIQEDTITVAHLSSAAMESIVSISEEKEGRSAFFRLRSESISRIFTY